ncbi:MAG: histone deacetylase [Chloroflexota bacterium]
MIPPLIALTLVPSPEHNSSGHPENVERFQHFGRLQGAAFAERLLRLESQPAREEDLTTVHPAAYLHALQQAVARGPGYIDYAPTYVTQASYRAALDAAGGTLQVVEAVAAGRARSGFALVRPPGHHATPTEAMGFCLINNLAVATRRVQQLGFRRVMIADFDVHHGNGSQAVFERDPEVLFLSTHQSGIYPGSGDLNETGVGEGQGTVINIPLPAGAGDHAFAEIYDRIVGPAAERFAPQFLMVSAGFDAHWADPLAGLQLTCSGFYHLGRALADLAERLCDGRLVLVLEGGYDPEALASSVMAVLAALAGLPAPSDPVGPAPYPEPSVQGILHNVQAIHGL